MMDVTSLGNIIFLWFRLLNVLPCDSGTITKITLTFYIKHYVITCQWIALPVMAARMAIFFLIYVLKHRSLGWIEPPHLGGYGCKNGNFQVKKLHFLFSKHSSWGSIEPPHYSGHGCQYGIFRGKKALIVSFPYLCSKHRYWGWIEPSRWSGPIDYNLWFSIYKI